MKVGDIVRIKQTFPKDWPEVQDKIGVILNFGKRLHIPAAKVMVLGEIAEFDLDELETVNESR